MILGVGVDVEEIVRFKEKLFDENKSFYGRIFTSREIEYCLSKYNPYAHFTGRFAAKEAVFKALNSVVKVSLSDIEIENDTHGVPNAVLKCYLPEGISLRVSISHAKEYAVAFAIVEREG